MANRYTRRAIEDYIAANFSTPYYPSVNIDDTPADDIWCSVDWGVAFPRKLTFCDEFEYDGNFQIMFFGAGGIGDETLLLQAESDVLTLQSFVDPNAKLTLGDITSAEDFRQDIFYAVSFTVEYVLHD